MFSEEEYMPYKHSETVSQYGVANATACEPIRVTESGELQERMLKNIWEIENNPMFMLSSNNGVGEEVK
jgi:hypothetical protein